MAYLSSINDMDELGKISIKIKNPLKAISKITKVIPTPASQLVSKVTEKAETIRKGLKKAGIKVSAKPKIGKTPSETPSEVPSEEVPETEKPTGILGNKKILTYAGIGLGALVLILVMAKKK